MNYTISNKILLVDDQSEITDLLVKQLSPQFDCLAINSPSEALAALLVDGPFAVVISDYQMPDINGVDLLHEVNQRSPDSIPMMLTAHGEVDIAVAALHEGNIFRFLRKPWDKALLIKSICDAQEMYRVKVTERLLSRELKETNQSLSEKVQQLVDINKLMQHWVEFSPAVVYSFVIDGNDFRTSYVSKNFESLTGYDRTQLLSQPDFLQTLIHPDDLEGVLSNLKQAIEAEQDPGVMKYRLQHKEGHYICIQDASRIAFNPLNNHTELVGAWLKIESNSEQAA